MKYRFWLTIVILFLIAIFIGGCIYTNNVDIVVSVLKVFAYIVPTAIGSYFVGLTRGKKSRQNNNTNYANIIEEDN